MATKTLYLLLHFSLLYNYKQFLIYFIAFFSEKVINFYYNIQRTVFCEIAINFIWKKKFEKKRIKKLMICIFEFLSKPELTGVIRHCRQVFHNDIQSVISIICKFKNIHLDCVAIYKDKSKFVLYACKARVDYRAWFYTQVYK